MSLKGCAVVEKAALSQLRVEGHPVAVVIGLADIMTSELIGCGLDVKLKAFDAFASLKAIFSFANSC